MRRVSSIFLGLSADPLEVPRGPPGSADHRLKTPGLSDSVNIKEQSLNVSIRYLDVMFRTYCSHSSVCVPVLKQPKFVDEA